MLVIQPSYTAKDIQSDLNADSRTVEFELQKKFNMSKQQVNSLKIEVILIAKKQSIIMNYIPIKGTPLRNLTAENNDDDAFKFLNDSNISENDS